MGVLAAMDQSAKRCATCDAPIILCVYVIGTKPDREYLCDTCGALAFASGDAYGWTQDHKEQVQRG